MVDWLSEILYLQDAEGWQFREFETQRLDDHSLAAPARGEKLQRPRHQAEPRVKAITYHQLALEETPQGWRAQVYVDIDIEWKRPPNLKSARIVPKSAL